VDPGAKFIHAQLGDLERLNQIFSSYNIQSVIHLAAQSVVAHSMVEPQAYFQNNVVYGMNLLYAMVKHSVKKLVFSSSAAVCGHPKKVPITENQPPEPVNPYGESKLMFERMLHWYAQAYGLSFISLRYFNAAGASLNYGEDHDPETHLIPNVLEVVLNQNPDVVIFGTDYATRDGTCIRDFVHVVDIAQAHLLALEKIGNLSGNIYNLGNGNGYSVLEVIKTAEEVAGVKIPVKFCPRRLGDPAVLVASAERAKRELCWKPQFSKLEDIIESAWRWLKDHPDGYEK
jgi:UDP-glucose 4-epimerase